MMLHHYLVIYSQSKYLIDINELDIDKIVIPEKVSYSKKGFKYFIGYKEGNNQLINCV